jgi:hypothetical protein
MISNQLIKTLNLKNILTFFTLLVLLNSCATRAGYNKLCKNWIGHKEQDLIMTWGSPYHVNKMDNGYKIIMYKYSNEYVTPVYQKSRTNVRKRTLYGDYQVNTTTNTSGGQKYAYWCETSFEIDPSGYISRYAFRGNNCRAKE